jgi:ABC-type glycerol-3-phosphate transport system substrate-binding protein
MLDASRSGGTAAGFGGHHDQLTQAWELEEIAHVKRALVIMTAFILAACGSNAPAPTPGASAPANTAAPAASAAASPQGDPTAPVTVWIDQDRQPAFDAYVKAHPDTANLLKAVIVDREQFPAKVLLFNNTKSGWPDVVFAEPRLVSRVSDAAHNFPLDLTGIVPDDVIKDYDGQSNCIFDGRVLCLRNDLAQFVLYYNKPLMDQFGYTVPTTWEEYQALSDKVAAEHPGYYMGTFGDAWSFLSYFEAANCPFAQVKDTSSLIVNPSDPSCTKVARMVDHMIANKTLWNTDYFDASFANLGTSGKLLMVPMAAWAWGVFDGTYKFPAGSLGVADPLKWSADAEPITAAMGGAAWTVSSHAKNVGLAVDFVQWVTQNPEFWKGTTNFPAYRPIQPLWHDAVKSNKLFANDPWDAMSGAAANISPLDNWPRFDLIVPLNGFVKDAYKNGTTIEASLPTLVDTFKPLAEAVGYEIVSQ